MGPCNAPDGALYQCTEGHYWLVCRRDIPHSPAQSANVDTGELRVYVDGHVHKWLPLKLSAVIRLIGPHTKADSGPPCPPKPHDVTTMAGLRASLEENRVNLERMPYTGIDTSDLLKAKP